MTVLGPVEALALGDEVELEEARARATGFDPRTLADEHVYLRLTPHTVQAWRCCLPPNTPYRPRSGPKCGLQPRLFPARRLERPH